MSTTTDPPPAAPLPPSRLDGAIARWLPLAAAWALHGLLLLYVLFGRYPVDRIAAVEVAAVTIGIAALVACEAGLLLLAAALVELAVPRGALGRWARPPLDAVRVLAPTGLLVTLAASSLKFVATSVHLRVSDLWFAYTNLLQILQEAQLAEALALLALPAAGVLLAVVLWLAVRRRPRARRDLGRRLLVSLALATAVLLLAARLSTVFPQFLRDVVPETHWLARWRSQPRFLADAAAPAGTAGERPIAPYRDVEPRRPLNVVLIMLESIPWGRTPDGGGRPGVTPNLERLAAESVTFSRAYAASTHSDYAQMAVLSSLHPRKYPDHDYYLDIEYPRTLIWDALAPAGYATSLFSCQNERWGNMLSFLDTGGLDVLRHSLDWPEAPKKGRGLESKVYEPTPVGEWMAWRRRRARTPYFTYLNFQSNHFPYEIPPDEPRPYAPFELDFPASFLRYPRDKVPVMLNRFDNALRFADRWVGEVVEFLRAIGDWETTVLVVVSDHGEAFYEHDQPTHGTSLHEEQVRSLLMIRAPGLAPRTVEEPVALLDVPPTLLEVLGLPAHGNFQGRSDILDPAYDASGRPIFFTIQGLTLEDGLVLDGWKLIVNWDRRTKQLFDLNGDPGETRDLATVEDGRRRTAERLLGDFLQRQLAYYEQRRWEAGYYPPPLP